MAPLGTTEREPLTEVQAETFAPAAEPRLEPNWPGTSAPRRARLELPWRKIALIAFPLLLIGGGYAGYTRLLHRPVVQDVQRFVVARRSFPVILKERGELKPNNSIDIRSELEGRSTIIYLIPEGSRVKEGELLIELASDEIDNSIRDNESKEANALAAYEAAVKTREIQRDENASKVRKAELQLLLARLAQEKYVQGELKELEQDATLAVDKAQMVLDREQQDYKDAQELFSEGFITRVELKDAEFNAYAAKLDLDKAKLALEVLKKYTIPMALKEKESDVREAEKELEREKKAAEAAEAKATAEVEAAKRDLDIVRDKLAKLRDQKKKSKILAPAEGLVVYAREHGWRSENTIDTGVQVHERQLLLQLPDTSQMKVECRVHEAQIERLAVGMPARVTIEGFDGRVFTGKVSRIAVMADSQNYWLNPNLREYKTDILLDGTYTELKPNTTARVEIQVAQLEQVLAVPVQAVFAQGGRFYVFLDEGGKVRPVAVEPGLASTDYVEIKSGLSEGQVIRLAITDEMKLLLPDDSAAADDGEPGDSRPSRPRSVEQIRRPASQPTSMPSAGRPGQDDAATHRRDRASPRS
ncbi:MAG TPA: efflux RND transporter periplasmic adaptor subunit [Phycisphaerae bacterium]|nr:efflux RND transporter periplasmic adaptor subunit [Phycisphaerae bacterium]HOJ75279.1 efflux RND transporter periplasmic adaptor subunit [Phycisphaerae bacterium]HOM53056.1 efflux RND transporter periplasmic adaptor subunit [Phycisphaerae bacterium]HON67384.1 efflux RND transporter periplasmic adaptor subunit [Phycisphaerae bacterium]HOQ87921.1 efflux RND transporter periplasmic adaptor subunit [Phycisphaerae bacterium]